MARGTRLTATIASRTSAVSHAGCASSAATTAAILSSGPRGPRGPSARGATMARGDRWLASVTRGASRSDERRLGQGIGEGRASTRTQGGQKEQRSGDTGHGENLDGEVYVAQGDASSAKCWIMRYQWTTLVDGRTDVVLSPGRSEIIVFDERENIACMRGVEPHVGLIEEHAERTGFFAGWIGAVIWAESRGDVKARSGDGGRGLMQLTHPSLTVGLSDAEVMRPEVNVQIGSDLLAKLSHRLDGMPNGLPTIASLYNAGGQPGNLPHPSEANPWGMRCTDGYIDRVVKAANVLIPWLAGGICR